MSEQIVTAILGNGIGGNRATCADRQRDTARRGHGAGQQDQSKNQSHISSPHFPLYAMGVSRGKEGGFAFYSPKSDFAGAEYAENLAMYDPSDGVTVNLM